MSSRHGESHSNVMSDKPPLFAASPLSDAELDGPAPIPTARRRDGLTFCPHCHGGIASNAELSGQEVSCPHCSCSFLMPETIDLRIGIDPVGRSGGASSREPWFYRFIDIYASVWLWLTVLVFCGVVAVVLGLVVGFGPQSPLAMPWAFLIPIGLMVLMVPTFVGILLTVALMRITVDIARNLREIRLQQSRKPL